MKTSVIEVREMLSVLSVAGVEERIGKVPGVESVTLNFATGSATVRYDETRLEIGDIKAAVRQDGYEADGAPATGAAATAPAPAPAPAPAAVPQKAKAAGPAPSEAPKPSPDAAGPAPAPAAADHASGQQHPKAAPGKGS